MFPLEIFVQEDIVQREYFLWESMPCQWVLSINKKAHFLTIILQNTAEHDKISINIHTTTSIFFLISPSHLIVTHCLCLSFIFLPLNLTRTLSESSFNLFTVSIIHHPMLLFYRYCCHYQRVNALQYSALLPRTQNLNDTLVKQLKFCNQAACDTTIYLRFDFLKQFTKAPVHLCTNFYIHFKGKYLKLLIQQFTFVHFTHPKTYIFFSTTVFIDNIVLSLVQHTNKYIQ